MSGLSLNRDNLRKGIRRTLNKLIMLICCPAANAVLTNARHYSKAIRVILQQKHDSLVPHQDLGKMALN